MPLKAKSFLGGKIDMPASTLTFCEPTPSLAARAKVPKEAPKSVGMVSRALAKAEDALKEAKEDLQAKRDTLEEAKYGLDEARDEMKLALRSASEEEEEQLKAAVEEAKVAVTEATEAIEEAKATVAEATVALKAARAAEPTVRATELAEMATLAARVAEPEPEPDEGSDGGSDDEPAGPAPTPEALVGAVSIAAAANKKAAAAVMLAVGRLVTAHTAKATAHAATKVARTNRDDAVKDAATKRIFGAAHFGHQLDKEYFKLCTEDAVPTTLATLKEAKHVEEEATAAVPVAEAALKAAQDVEAAAKVALVTARYDSKKEKMVKLYTVGAEGVSAERGVPAWLARCYETTADRGDAIGSTMLLDAYVADTGIDMSPQAFGREMKVAHGDTAAKKKRTTAGFAYLGIRRRVGAGSA